MNNEKHNNITFKGKFFKEGFSKELPIIEATEEELYKVRDVVLDLNDRDFNKFMYLTDNYKMPIENLIISITDTKNSFKNTIQVIKKNGILNCIVGVNDSIILEYNVTPYEVLVSKVFYNKQDPLVENGYEMFFKEACNPTRILNTYLLIVGAIFLATNNNVKFVTTESPVSAIRKTILKELNIDIADLEDETETRQQNKMIKENKIQNKVISLGKQRIINLADITTKLTSPTRTNKPCEFSFTRRGHWAYSHKTGKKWWVSETVVNKDKPRKQTRYKIDIDTGNSVDDK